MLNEKDFYMPAEWERHERTFIEWPVKSSMVWPDNYEEVCQGYATAAVAISKYEKVTVIADKDTLDYAKGLCGNNNIEYLTVPHNDAWCRDNGPTFLLNKEKRLAAVNWQFNAWGAKYPEFDLDNQVAPRILEHYKVPFFNSPIILEGGSIHVDGEGTLLTTEECLLNSNRNPHLTKEQLEAELKTRLGVSKIIWLSRGLYGDETDGHIDNVACFAEPGVILIQTCSNPDDPNYEISIKNIEILKNTTDARGRNFKIIEIPQPPERHYRDVRLTLSYLNFYIVNGGIILPVFGEAADKSDIKAIEILKKVFPAHDIVPIDGMPLIKEGGNIHCITQQMPEGVI